MNIDLNNYVRIIFSFVLFALDAKRTKKVKAEKSFHPHATTPPRFSAGPPLLKFHTKIPTITRRIDRGQGGSVITPTTNNTSTYRPTQIGIPGLVNVYTKLKIKALARNDLALVGVLIRIVYYNGKNPNGMAAAWVRLRSGRIVFLRWVAMYSATDWSFAASLNVITMSVLPNTCNNPSMYSLPSASV